jgi:xylan 1,4-beta-xylosidase
MMRRGWRSSIALLVLALAVTRVGAQVGESGITVDATAPTRPFPHFWERMFGSGRARRVRGRS